MTPKGLASIRSPTARRPEGSRERQGDPRGEARGEGRWRSALADRLLSPVGKKLISPTKVWDNNGHVWMGVLVLV
jgi:hypothetical protein